MNINLIKNYIDTQPLKIVEIDWANMTLKYLGIKECQKRTKADPEELVRAYVITKLVNECGYLPDRIEIEHEYTAGRPHTITSRIDIIVRDSKGDAFLFIEVKNPDEYAIIDKDKTIEEQICLLENVFIQEAIHQTTYSSLVYSKVKEGFENMTLAEIETLRLIIPDK